ncbi:MAG: AMP-binding protein, partial [bacterium]|nr:AMP-binding protein [bacterium]
MYEFNSDETPYPSGITVYRLFEEQVRKTPGEIALIEVEAAEGRKTLTYRELNENANRLARMLRARGVGTNTVVGIMMQRSIQLIETIYAVIKAGGTYLPIDSELPVNRISGMLDTSRASLLITRQKIIDKKSADSSVTIKANLFLPHQLTAEIAACSGENLEPINGPGDLIYIIFTSGSTGTPKGAGVFHHSFINLIHWFVREFKLEPRDKNLLITSCSFDLTMKNLYASLVSGGTLCIPGTTYFEPQR